MSLAEEYNEHAAIALRSCRPQLDRLGVEVVGILGNDDHKYGYHLSKARLIGTGRTGDASLFGAKNVPCVDDRAACAIDYAMDWPASGEHLEDTRRRVAAGELHQITQIIGDPDLIPGAPRDIRDAAYAAASTGWRWVEYQGLGHVTWSHIGIGRRYSNDADFGAQLFGKWNRDGLIVPAPNQEDDMQPDTKFTLTYAEADGSRGSQVISYAQYMSLMYEKQQEILAATKGDTEAQLASQKAQLVILGKIEEDIPDQAPAQ